VARRAAVAVAAAALDARDGGTAAHSDDVVLLCDAVAAKLGIDGEDRAHLLAAAQLHDIGKVAISQEILDKPGPLNEDEWKQIRQHTIVGERILRSVPELGEVADIVRASHERFDGRGYPDRLAGEDIPLASRIVFCADAFHAIRSDRPYRQGRPAGKALREVRRGAGSQFDPVVAQALEGAARDLRIATKKKGSGGLTATVRSRRVASLLLTLVVGGSAMAATGNFDAVIPGRGDDDSQASPASRSPASDETGAGTAAASGPANPRSTAARRRLAATRRAARRRGAGRFAGVPAAGPGATAAPDRGTGSARVSPRAEGNSNVGGNANGHATAPGQLKPKPEPPRGKPDAPPGRPDSPGRSGVAPGRPEVPGPAAGVNPGGLAETPGTPTTPPVTPPGLGNRPAKK
jgi:putative nucleotidyltransferase with HDIG domain